MINLEKRIRRHVIGVRHDFFATTLPECEDLCRQELAGLGQTLEIHETVRGGVAFSGRLTDLYRANLRLRTAGRVLMRLLTFKATGFGRLEKQAETLAWSLYLPAGCIPEVSTTAHHSRLYHTRAVAEHLKRVISAHWAALGTTATPSKEQTLYARLVDDTVTISLDSSGDNLYRRGLKIHSAAAPVRETLAAVILRLAGYDPARPLLDPMCGAGTFSLEAALMAKAVAPGASRRFAFMQWPAFRPRQWHYLTAQAAQEVIRLERPAIHASDRDEDACTGLSACVRANGLEDAVAVSRLDFFDLRPDRIGPAPGLIVLNPPYGRRLSADDGTASLYHRIAAKLRQDFKGWKAALLVPDTHLAHALRLPLKTIPLLHGGLQLTLLTGKLRKNL